MRWLTLSIAFLSIMLTSIARAEDANAPAELREEWHDADRNRAIPIKIDYPKVIDKPLPVVLISHGLGGSREGLAYVGQYWAQHGYIAVHLQHPGSDETIWKGVDPQAVPKALKNAMSVEQFSERIKDVNFALDELARKNKEANWPLKGKLDLNQIAMAGHSFGAVTTMAMCGELFTGGISFGDARIKAGIVFSPSPPAARDPKVAFKDITIPMFYWTGTKDEVAISPVTPAERRVPFDSSTAGNQYLVVLKDGDHMVFNGTRLNPGAAPRPNDPAWHELIEKGTTAFLDKYLKSDAAQGKYLDDGTFATEAKKLGTFEKRDVKKVSVRTLDTKNYAITITDNRPEGFVEWNDVKYRGVSKKSGKAINLTGSDYHNLAKDGSPGRFLGYQFKNGDVTYIVLEEGRLTVTRNDSEVLVDESGAWRE
ncbi:MAG TPA: hypothetical protein VFE47_25250 [Tepidisphaeraceae bacterium]|jgi:predicted dienelactone hydrolase|nr:hypothetical protein [Tepidisphaeraceae bacterium]